MKRVAVILCGSGYKDGSEIRESVAVFWALSRHAVDVGCFAPDANQADVVNCMTGQVVANESRNMLVESARIARGRIRPLSELDPKAWDALILPGGFGAAKNLCSFASEGSRANVRPELRTVIESMFASKKPLGAVCIAPAILALALKARGLELTVGAAGEASQEIEKLGHRHVVKKANECHVDSKNRVVTTPAYMYDGAPLFEIFSGIQLLVDEVVRMA